MMRNAASGVFALRRYGGQQAVRHGFAHQDPQGGGRGGSPVPCEQSLLHTTPQSQKILEDLSRRQVTLHWSRVFPLQGDCKGGKIFVSNVERHFHGKRVIAEVTKLARKVPGVEEAVVSTTHSITSD